VKVAILLALALGLTRCGSSPNPAFYTLSGRSGSSFATPPLRIELRRPGLPGYLDRPHIVRRVTAEKLALDADERWGAPLEEMVGATLTAELSERLPNCIVYSEGGSISSAADARVEVQFSRFELTEDGAVKLLAQVGVHWSAAPEATRIDRHELSAVPASGRTADVVGSMSLLLSRLADSIAKAILRGPPKLASPAPEPGLTSG
jgi:uncharacterized lipoprotein YmbA